MTRIGFIGAGKHAQWAHIPSYALVEGVELAAVADTDLGLAKAVAQKFGIRKAYPSHTEMISKEKLDLVVVVLPAMPASEEILCDLLAARIPLVCEKPLAFSVPSAERVAAIAAKAGSFFRVAYHKRSDPAILYARREIERLVKSGELGKLKYARVLVSLMGNWTLGAYAGMIKGTVPMPAPVPLPAADFKGMSPRAVQEFPMFAAAHSHQFDLLRCLLGEAYHVAYADPSGVLLAVESESGVPAVFEFSPYNSTKNWVEYALVAFERGYLKVELPAPLAMYRAGTVEYFRDDVPAVTMPVFGYKSAMQEQAENVIAALKGEDRGLCTVDQAVEAMIIARDWAMRLFP